MTLHTPSPGMSGAIQRTCVEVVSHRGDPKKMLTELNDERGAWIELLWT